MHLHPSNNVKAKVTCHQMHGTALQPKLPIMTNPLEIPEIITMVGQWLPLWNFSLTWNIYIWTTSDLARCTRVNKTWRKALLPVLWYLYDPLSLHTAPSEVLSKYSHHVRVLYVRRVHPIEDFIGCTMLTELHLWDSENENLPLLRQNAQLKKLEWQGVDLGDHLEDAERALESVGSTLVELTLTARGAEMALLPKIQAMPLLQKLVLPELVLEKEGIASLWTVAGGCPPMSAVHLRVPEETFRQMLPLCPHLETLVLTIKTLRGMETIKDCVDIPQICLALKRHCPKVKTFQVGKGWNELEFSNTGDLVKCKFRLPDLSPELADYLMKAKESLRELRMENVYLERRVTVDSLCGILMSCARLGTVSISAKDRMDHQVSSEVLARPWASTDLERLTLDCLDDTKKGVFKKVGGKLRFEMGTGPLGGHDGRCIWGGG